MKNIKLAIGIGSLLTLVVGAYITREKWMPLLKEELENIFHQLNQDNQKAGEQLKSQLTEVNKKIDR